MLVQYVKTAFGHGLKTKTAQGKAECCISLLTTPLVAFFHIALTAVLYIVLKTITLKFLQNFL